MRQVDWRARGFDGRVLGYLLLQNGYYHCGHRASADVDALIQMLRHRDDDGRTALSEMIECGSKPSWIVRARGAAFDLKDELRARGYRWDAAKDRSVWWREVSDDDLVKEQFWLAAKVYAVDARPQRIGPEIVRVTPRTRFVSALRSPPSIVRSPLARMQSPPSRTRRTSWSAGRRARARPRETHWSRSSHSR